MPPLLRCSTRSARAAAASECVTSTSEAPCSRVCAISTSITLAAVRRVEVAGGLVGQQQRRPVHQRARDRHALQLAAAQLLRQPRRRARRGRPPRASAPRAPRRRAAPSSISGSATFCATSRCGSTWKAWNTKPTCRRRQQRALLGVERADVDAVVRDAAGVPAVEAGHAVEQRRLADARFADDRDELARRDLERDVLEHGAVAVALGQARRCAASSCNGRHCAAATCASASGASQAITRRAAACCAAR